MKLEKSCGAILISKEAVLLVHQQLGHWDFPKGHMEKNETEIETAIREVKEETNLTVAPLPEKKYTIRYRVSDEIEKEVVFFVAKEFYGEIKPQLSEISEIKWVPFEKANDFLTFDSAKQLFQTVMQDQE